MKMQRIGFNSGFKNLDGIISIPDTHVSKVPGVAICNMHPIFGGGMDSYVVKNLSNILAMNGIASLRFDFGNLNSDNADFMSSMSEDLESAVKTLKDWPNINNHKVGLIGVSIGSNVILNSLAQFKNIKGVFMVSPSVNFIKRSSISTFKSPTFFIIGGQDKFVSPINLKSEVDKIETSELMVIEGSDHTWEQFEDTLAKSASDFFNKIFSI